MAQPKDSVLHAYLTEIEGMTGLSNEEVENVIEMAIENLVTEWNLKFDGEKVYRKGKKNCKLERKDVMLDSLVQSAKGAGNKKYTVALVAAIFIYDVA